MDPGSHARPVADTKGLVKQGQLKRKAKAARVSRAGADVDQALLHRGLSQCMLHSVGLATRRDTNGCWLGVNTLHRFFPAT